MQVPAKGQTIPVSLHKDKKNSLARDEALPERTDESEDEVRVVSPFQSMSLPLQSLGGVINAS